MVLINIRLVGEQKDRTFNAIDLDNQILYVDLKKRIETVTKIPVDFQQIEFRGEELPVVERPMQTIQFGEELVVKHADLPWWVEYKECVELVLKQCSDKVEIAKTAVEHHERLMESGFFKVYAEFANFRRQKHYKVAAWTDGDVNLIREATEQYFRSLHDKKRGNEDSEFICYFKERDASLGGRSTNTIVFVQLHGEKAVSKYNVKCYHYGPKGTSSGQVPDISEFYCYKLLELIGVGPKCHIIPPKALTGTKTSTYIATQWDDKFELLENLIDENNLCVDVVVQLVMLRVFLFISDLHEQNCGKWKGTKYAAIVDFAPTNDFKVYRDIKSELLTTFPHKGWKKVYSSVKSQHDDISWLKIAKIYFDKWDLPGKLESARIQLDPTKTLLKNLEIGFKKRQLRFSPTDQLNEYIDTLNKNLENLQTILNSINL